MGEALRLLNRHGIKIWFSTLIGGLVIITLLLVPHLLIGMMLLPKLDSFQQILSGMAASPDVLLQAGQLAGKLQTALAEARGAIFAYFIAVLLITGLSLFFYTAGFIGTVREAVVEDEVSIGNFFSYGIRYMLRILGLGLIYALLFAVWGAGSFFSLQSAPTGSPVEIILYVVSGLFALVLLMGHSLSLVILFVEEIGILRSVGNGFRAAFIKFGQSLYAVAGSILLGGVSWILIGILISFPWLVLQFMGDSTVALIVGVGFGALMFLALYTIPPILSLGVLFTRYVLSIQEDLFPEDVLAAFPSHPSKWDENEEDPDANGNPVLKDQPSSL